MHRCLGVLALLALVQAAEAEEKFYSIVGPDGGVQIIRSTAEPDNEKPSASGKEERPEPRGDGASTAAKKKTRKPGPSAPAPPPRVARLLRPGRPTTPMNMRTASSWKAGAITDCP